MTVAAPPKTWMVSPEILATRNGCCSHCRERIRKGEDYVARVDGAPDGSWMHALCAKAYARHLEHFAELNSEDGDAL